MNIYRWRPKAQMCGDMRGEFVVLAADVDQARYYLRSYAEDTGLAGLDFTFLEEEPEVYDPADGQAAIVTFMIQIG